MEMDDPVVIHSYGFKKSVIRGRQPENLRYRIVADPDRNEPVEWNAFVKELRDYV
jgi:hypothetical protein